MNATECPRRVRRGLKSLTGFAVCDRQEDFLHLPSLSVTYKERLTREYRVPVVGALTLENTFAFVMTQFYTEYDADNQVLSVRVVSKTAIDEENYAGNYGYLLWSGSESKAGSFIGSNAFGVKRRVSVYRGTAFYLALHESVLDGPDIGDLRMKCSLSPQELPLARYLSERNEKYSHIVSRRSARSRWRLASIAKRPDFGMDVRSPGYWGEEKQLEWPASSPTEPSGAI